MKYRCVGGCTQWKVIIVLLMLGVLVWNLSNREPVPNPDPNHTHADFAVWVDQQQVDFSDPKYMSGLSTDEHTHDEPGEYLHEHLHLHDGVGHVIHSHKPGQTLREFFDSIGYEFPEPIERWTMWINGQEEEFNLDYQFQDLDQIMLTNDAGAAQIGYELERLTDDACLYSRTCPWRGNPPTENCVADPEIPCVIPR